MNLRKAAEQALEALEGNCTNPVADPEQAQKEDRAIQALRQALEQPEQEPVCFLRETSWSYEIAPWDDPNGIPVYTAPPKPEYATEVVAVSENGIRTVKQTAIPKRDWVGLTADEIWKCNKAKAGSAVEFHICSAHQNVMDFAEAIEAKLKEKNT
jgi:hypothetical protein